MLGVNSITNRLSHLRLKPQMGNTGQCAQSIFQEWRNQTSVSSCESVDQNRKCQWFHSGAALFCSVLLTGLSLLPLPLAHPSLFQQPHHPDLRPHKTRAFLLLGQDRRAQQGQIELLRIPSFLCWLCLAQELLSKVSRTTDLKKSRQVPV